MSDSMRLDKRLAQLIHCSRGEAQKYIKGGWVLVDGEVVDRPAFSVQEQKVELHTDATLEAVEPVTFLLHYPVGFDVNASPTAPIELITAATRTPDDSYGIAIHKSHFSKLKATAPLEQGATGLLVFTNDWQVERRLIEDADKNEQEYIVEVNGDINADVLKKLNQPMKQGIWPLPETKVSMQSETRLRFALKYVRPGQIEYMCQHVGLKVAAMRRIRIGRVSMGKLPLGQWRYLPKGMAF